MNTVERLEQALRVAKRLGYNIRHEFLDGGAGGTCEIRGEKWMFVDLAICVSDQLDQVIDGLRFDPAIRSVALPEELLALLNQPASRKNTA